MNTELLKSQEEAQKGEELTNHNAWELHCDFVNPPTSEHFKLQQPGFLLIASNSVKTESKKKRSDILQSSL